MGMVQPLGGLPDYLGLLHEYFGLSMPGRIRLLLSHLLQSYFSTFVFGCV